MRTKAPGYLKIASERISKLLSEADSGFKEHPELSKRYVYLARKISMKYKIKFTPEQKKLFCKKCNSYLRNGVSSRVRLEHGKIVTTCLGCGAMKRVLYKKKK
jgi:ribonuclease P protein subunit RPR2